MIRAPAQLLADLVERVKDEMVALEAGDLSALAQATRAKLAAVEALAQAPAGSVPRAAVAEAAALNRVAARRVNAMRARVDQRLAALARASGLGLAGAYGPDGRPVIGIAWR